MDAPACESCKIVFIASDVVFATYCGHMFHDGCLDIIFNSNTKHCPNCNIICLRSQSLRIYLPFQQETSTPESLVIKRKMVKHELKEIQKQLQSESGLQANLDNFIERANAMKNRKIQKVAELKEMIKGKENLMRTINEHRKSSRLRH